MSTRRSSILALAAICGVALLAGCNYQGEEPTKEKDFAVSNFNS